MSGYFDGRNGRLSKTLRDLRDLQFEDICWIVAVLTGKFLKSLRNHTSHQIGGLFGGILVIGLILRSLWALYKMHETLWFGLVSIVFVCWTSSLQRGDVCMS